MLGKLPSIQKRYFITSLPCDAANILAAKRAHWQIENSLHWCLDVAFHEDDHRLAGHAAANLALIRHIALSLLKQEPSKKSLRRKRKLAGWDLSYLDRLLEPI